MRDKAARTPIKTNEHQRLYRVFFFKNAGRDFQHGFPQEMPLFQVKLVFVFLSVSKADKYVLVT
jgi:hypothetical protein